MVIKETYITLTLNAEETLFLKVGKSMAGIRSNTEFLRFLMKKYVHEQEQKAHERV